jgi:exonuclease SbcD
MTEEADGNKADQSRQRTQVFALENSAKEAQAVICAIPFIRPRDVIKSKAGQSATEKQKSLQQAISEHYQNLYQQAQLLVSEIEKDQGILVPIIATGHLTALGVSMSDSQSDAVRDIYIGTLEAFPSSAFPPVDYIALGHIHRAQKVGKTEHIRYCGSPIALSFDEAKQDKRVLLVDFSSNKLNTVTDLIIPRFQPLFMIKATLENLPEKLDEALAHEKLNNVNNSEKIWLDIEIDNSEHLSDLSNRVNNIVSELPVEVLLVRRSKKSRQLQQGLTQKNITLNELSVDEVFNSRLTELDWPSDEELARKERLGLMFKQVAAQVTEQSKTELSKLEQIELEKSELANIKLVSSVEASSESEKEDKSTKTIESESSE